MSGCLVKLCISGTVLLKGLKMNKLNMTFTVLCRDRRKMQISSIGWWESWSRSQSISRRRVWSHMGEALSGLMPWRHTFHAIEGKAVLKSSLEIHLVSCYTL